MKIIVTGGAGFIGSHFIRYWLQKHRGDFLINLDSLTYAGNVKNLSDIVEKYGDKYLFVHGDITDFNLVEDIFSQYTPDILVNFAAESHNSYAILNPGKFFQTNVIGTQTLLEVARKKGIGHFQHISTCEVYGDLPLDSNKSFSEDCPCQPKTPYNASKAGADLAVLAYHSTFGIPAVISRCSNNYGTFQFPEKVIPLFATNALSGQSLPLYRQSQNKREWVHVLDHCRAIELMISNGKFGNIYNIGTGIEKTVEEIADCVLDGFGLPKSLKNYVEDRPGHDRRYLLDSSKARKELGWAPLINFDDGLRETLKWYSENEYWWKPLKLQTIVQESKWKIK